MSHGNRHSAVLGMTRRLMLLKAHRWGIIRRDSDDDTLEVMTPEQLEAFKQALHRAAVELNKTTRVELKAFGEAPQRAPVPPAVDVRERRTGWRLEKPPGHLISATLRVMFGRHAFERVFGQILRDANEEWVDAAAAGNKIDQRRIRFYTPVHLLLAAALYPMVWLAKAVDLLRKVWPASPVKKD